MPRKIIVNTSDSNQKMRPALTPEARENQMIALAMDLVEQRLLNGTASSQETTHFLKLASSKEKLEREKLQAEKQLLESKIKNLESQTATEVLYANAIKAMSIYTGNAQEGDDDDNEF